MSSLFWKIFLWFWLAIILLIGVLLILNTADEPRERTRRRDLPLDSLLAMYGQTALTIRETGGDAALAEFLGKLGKSSSGEAFLFSPDGKEVVGRAFPPEAQTIARNAFEEDGDDRYVPFPFLSRRVVDKGGQQYALVIQYDEIPITPHRRNHPLHLLMDTYGQTALRVLTTEGTAALARFLRQVGPSEDVEAFLFSSDGKELAGRSFPSDVEEIVHEALTQPERRYVPFPFLSHRLVDKEGQNYVLVIQYGEMPIKPPKSLRKPWYAAKTLLGSSTLTKVLAIFLMAGIVCLGLAYYLTRRIIKVRVATQELAEGHLSARVGTLMRSRRGELANLSHDIDLMAERIESLMNSQRQLIKDVAHELRSPLTRLNVALELARQEAGLNGKKALERVQLESNRLNELIQQLLDLSRLESGAETFEQERVDLELLVRAILEDAAFEAESQTVRVELTTTDIPTTVGSLNMLRSAIENVVRNAIQYSPEDSAVEVSLQSVGDHLEVVVRDHGPGVPPEHLDKIFTPFYRVANSRDRKTGGTGLGLAIAQRVVQAHGGAVSAQNHPDGGLSVTIRLPADLGAKEE